MRLDPRLDDYRVVTGEYASPIGASYGMFEMPGPCGERLVIIASDDADRVAEGWEHVSVSTRRRIPNWIEMCFAKDLFWAPEDCVVQFHPPQSAHINNHPNVLHLWRSTTRKFPMPPSILVGCKDMGIIETKEQAEEAIRRVAAK
jgi:hypothetical protein